MPHRLAQFHAAVWPRFAPSLTNICLGSRRDIARQLYSLDFDTIAAERAAPGIAPRPILFVHGSEDERIPVEHALAIKEKALGAEHPDAALT